MILNNSKFKYLNQLSAESLNNSNFKPLDQESVSSCDDTDSEEITKDTETEEITKDINVTEFLNIFINDYFRKAYLLEHMFNNQYENIVKYLDSPNNLDINKYNKCAKFFNKYSDYLDDQYGFDGYEYLCIAMSKVLEFFGGYDEYNKMLKYSEKIHHEHIGRGLAKLHKIYPKIVPKFKKATTCFFKSYMTIDFHYNDEKATYMLIYINKYWTLKYINYCTTTHIDTEKILVDNKSIDDIIEQLSLIF